MQRAVKVLFFIVIFTVGLFSVNYYLTAWRTFKPDGGGFSIEFPGNPKKETNTKTSGGVKLDCTTYMRTIRSSKNEEEAYVLGFADYPQSVDLSDNRRVLEAAVEGSVNSGKATLVSSNINNWKLKPAIDFEMKNYEIEGRQYQIKSRIILVNHRMYVTMAGASSAVPSNYQKFVDSFELTD